MAEAKVAPTLVLEPTKEFRLLPGKQHSHGKYDVQPGDIIHLNARQASAFRDKFEPVDPNAPFKAPPADVHQKFFNIAEARESGTVVEPVKAAAAAPA